MTAGDRALVMGVLNVTPDSFFDGGRYVDTAEAVARGRQMFAEGADFVDIGGESSRPGAAAVSETEELRRVVPVIEALAASGAVSVDTAKPTVARAAVAAGASLVNDITGTLWPVAAELGVPWVAMHMQGAPATMQDDPRYDDVVTEVREAVMGLARQARAAGVPEVWVDPGIGFGKRPEHNLALLSSLGDLVAAAAAEDCKVLVGTSRKRFLGAFGAPDPETPLGVEGRLEASLATAVWSLVHGAAMVRAHDVAVSVQAATLVGGSSGIGLAA
jgi:dihydropteroate synthase